MEKNEFKKTLIHLKNRDFDIPQQYNPYQLALQAMKYIGDIDAELRDELALTYLEAVILKSILNDNETRRILDLCMSNLNFELGKTNDSVFTRTFSLLVIAIIIYKHRNYKFLSMNELISIFEKVIYSYKNDNDVRGYVQGKGWAHGAAHGADVLAEFARLDEANASMMQRILDAIFYKTKIGHYGYIHNEDDRMARAVIAVIEAGKLPYQYYGEWIKKFNSPPGKGVAYIVQRNNVRNLLRSLYFRLLSNKQYQSLCDTIIQTLDNKIQ